MKSSVAVIEASGLREELQEELNQPAADDKLPVGIQSPAIIVRRHERATSFGDSYDFPKATYIDGYDETGNLIITKSLAERQSRVGKVLQSTVERLKIYRVQNALGRSALFKAYKAYP